MELDRRSTSASAPGLTAPGLALEELVHDLGQELAVLRHLVALLHAPRPGFAECDVLDALRQQVDALDGVVRSAVVPPPAGPVDVTRLATEVVAAARALHGGDLLLVAEPGCRVAGDPVLLRRVLLNLVVNAVEASPGGCVSVGVTCGAGRVCVEVTDDGRGAEPSDDRLGLGTWVVHAVVRDCGGTVERHVRDGGGRQVRVLLPSSGSDDEGPAADGPGDGVTVTA